MATRIYLRGFVVFAKAREQALVNRRSLPNSTSSPAAVKKLERTVQRRSSTHRLCGASYGMQRAHPARSRSVISLRSIDCAKFPVSMASRVLKQRQLQLTAISKTFDWRSMARRSRKTRTGFLRSNSSVRAFSCISTTLAIRDWMKRDAVQQREARLMLGYHHWLTQLAGKAPEFPGTPYVLLHSLSHALMQEIALDCGYPASSLKERVYALRSSSGVYDRCGILIYTASAGAQGTLGGLVGVAPRFADTLELALRRVEICSNDPVCADHDPDERSGDRATHGAACHGCLLTAETSCEMRNLFLDRALLVRTMQGNNTGFFGF